ncbi:MAG: ABC transporter ATP-binding protein [Acidimicrobiia bacterium]|nr:ABC transporter ATP-binding protein [Acidimicrobiia bacterium]MYB23676.1 ABC transporter ATP-binding protein [Acidimicrobiia bacterium]MYE66893.1 ABC transporter ATP-binding protein [Acidimicrobiia bacterium]MYJ14616.1 ABC transporter ATP-binding protein [Acidimicrobiia bacterium]
MPNARSATAGVPAPVVAAPRKRFGLSRNGDPADRTRGRVHAATSDRNGFLDLRIVGVSKSFGETEALSEIDLSIESGRTVSLLGPSGCGKTTLMRIVAGLEVADTGMVYVGDRLLAGPGTHVAPESRRIGLLGQERSLFPHLSVGANVAYGLGRAADRAARVAEVLEMVDLAGYERRMPDSLSGGQQQRVAIARALAPRPRMLLLDEPFQALDAHLRLELQTEVRALLGSLGATAVIVTHDQDEAFVMGDDVAVMRDGRIRQRGKPSEVYGHPESPWIASFVGDANFIPGIGRGSVVSTPLGDLGTCCHAAGKVAVLVRPSSLRMVEVETSGERDTSTQGRVESMRFIGHATECRVRLGDAVLLTRSDRMPTVRVGDEVTLCYDGPPAVTYPAAAVADLRRRGNGRRTEPSTLAR